MALLNVNQLNAYYGKSHILQGVNMSIDEGEIVSLLGRNGVGRSTTCKSIMGEVPPKGSITFRGKEIAGLAPHQIAQSGIGYVPENRDVFPGLTVKQNLNLGVKPGQGASRWSEEDFFELFPNLRGRQDVDAAARAGAHNAARTGADVAARPGAHASAAATTPAFPWRPDGQRSLDMTLVHLPTWDAAAYLVRSGARRDLCCVCARLRSAVPANSGSAHLAL